MQTHGGGRFGVRYRTRTTADRPKVPRSLGRAPSTSAIQEAFNGPGRAIGDEASTYLFDTVAATIEAHGGFIGEYWSYGFTGEGRLVFDLGHVDDADVAKLVGDTLGVEITFRIDPRRDSKPASSTASELAPTPTLTGVPHSRSGGARPGAADRRGR